MSPPELLLAVFDVDGVVADVRHRLHHLARRPKDWGRFFAEAGRDPSLDVGIALAHEYAAGRRLIWLTGRPERLRALTLAWLVRHGLPVNDLLMRPTRDYRPAHEFKAEQVAWLGRTGRITIVVDDDPAVVARLTADGWPVRLADWVPYVDEVLHEAQEREGRT